MFLLEKFVIKFFVTSEKFNLVKYIENDIIYYFKIVWKINFIEKYVVFEKIILLAPGVYMKKKSLVLNKKILKENELIHR